MAKKIQLLRGQEAKLKSSSNPSGYVLSDAEFYVDTTQHKVFVGDTNATPDGRFTLANEADVEAVKTEVESISQDVADIQTDYAKTTGGNTLTPNSIAIADANGKLKGLTGTEGQFVKIGANGVPEVGDASGGALSHVVTATLPVTSGTSATVAISGITADTEPFMVIPQFTSAYSNEQAAWNQIKYCESGAGNVTFTLKSATTTAVTFKCYF